MLLERGRGPAAQCVDDDLVQVPGGSSVHVAQGGSAGAGHRGQCAIAEPLGGQTAKKLHRGDGRGLDVVEPWIKNEGAGLLVLVDADRPPVHAVDQAALVAELVLELVRQRGGEQRARGLVRQQ